MTRILTLLSAALLLTPIVSAVYTGFNYGAFWGEVGKVKTENDFRKGFKLASDLTTGTQFNSARLFTCKQQGTTDSPTEAFEAAVKTNTSLLLGFWVTPGNKGESMKAYIDQELSALAKGFKKHGQALSDLIIGLSVGSEDVFRFEDTTESGVSAKDISSGIATVKDTMKNEDFAQYMKNKPIGHVDTAKHAVVEGADFYGMTAYPYWNNEPVAKSKESFLGSLDNVKQRAGNTPVWIAEMGWPYDGPQRGDALTGKDSLQEFWTNVGCELIGKYNTFWFELIMDSEEGQPDWGMLNPDTHKPRIDLTCPGLSPPSGSTTAASSPVPTPTTLPNSPSSSASPAVSSPSVGNLTSVIPSTNISTSTVRITTTIVVTVQPSGAAPTLKRSSFGVFTNSSAQACPKKTQAPEPSLAPSEVPWCVTVADIAWNGQYVPVTGNLAGLDGSCSPPLTYTGLPYGSNAGIVSPSATSPAAVPSFSSVVSPVTSSIPQASSAVPVASSPATPIVSNSPAPSSPVSSPAAKPSGASPPKACHKH